MMSFFFFFLLFLFMFFFFDFLYIFSVFFFSMFLGFLLGISCLGFSGLSFGGVYHIDCLSFFLVLLTFWVFSMVFLLGFIDLYCMFLLLSLFFFLVISFMSPSFFWFYLFFECSMIPIFFLVMGWGGGQERSLSAYYMFVYTSVSSFPSLLIILFFFSDFGLTSFDYLDLFPMEGDSFFYFFFILVFMVKCPIFIFHIWLPKAHVDAPVYGSMILASVMLKLGGYGLFRLLSFWGCDVILFDFFFSLSLAGSFFLSLVCLFVSDMKVIVAYSSVVHMCVMVCGVISGVSIGYWGGFMMILSHGVCSSGLFMIINFFYSRFGSRMLFIVSGFWCVFPVLSYFWFFILLGNIGVPPSLSFFSEIYCLGSFVWNSWVGCFLILGGLFTMSCVSMNLVYYGFGDFMLGRGSPILISEYFLVFFHVFPLNVGVLFVGYFF